MTAGESTEQTLEAWWRTAESGSETNRLIARHLREHYRQAAFLSSADLAATIGVSQASVSRFAASLGFSGYAAWVKEMQQVIRLELSAADRLWYATNPHLEEDGPPRDRVLAGESQNLLALEHVPASPAFEQLAEHMAESVRVVVVSARAAATLVPYVHYFLGKVRPGVSVAMPGDSAWERLPAENPRDTFIFTLVYPRYPRALTEQLALLRERGFRIGGLTDRPDSPLVRYADIAVYALVTSASLFDSYAGPIVALNMLIRRVAQLTPETSRARLDEIERLDQQHRVYLT